MITRCVTFRYESLLCQVDECEDVGHKSELWIRGSRTLMTFFDLGVIETKGRFFLRC